MNEVCMLLEASKVVRRYVKDKEVQNSITTDFIALYLDYLKQKEEARQLHWSKLLHDTFQDLLQSE